MTNDITTQLRALVASAMDAELSATDPQQALIASTRAEALTQALDLLRAAPDADPCGEPDLTAAVDAAAQVFCQRQLRSAEGEPALWDKLDPIQRYHVRQIVTPLVSAAFKAVTS